MNVLFMTLLYPDELYAEACANAKTGIQNQINSYQKAFIEGIDACLEDGESLSIVNALPVGIFPRHYRKLFLKSATYDHGRLLELGGINLPWVKQKMRMHRAEKALLKWTQESSANRTVLIYTIYLPYLQAILRVKKKVPDLKVSVIVTDLPNEFGLSSGRKGLFKRIEYSRGRKQLALCKAMDGFVLLTEPMAEVLQCEDKPRIVIEGLISTESAINRSVHENEGVPTVLYTGTLSSELGIMEMMQAFADLPQFRLRICGTGELEQQVRQFADEHANIQYEGFVSHEQALAFQAEAAALINPRSPSGLFTKYSFPSKTLEYMRSGKPVICYHLEGIPADYDPFLHYISAPGKEGIAAAVQSLFRLTSAQREELGTSARQYVLATKNPQAQCQKLVSFLRSLI